MNEVSPKILKTVQTLAQIAAELRQGEHFKVTRLTLLKSLCSDPETAAKFALHTAKLTQKKMKEQDCPSHINPEDWEQYQRLAGQAVRGMAHRLSHKRSRYAPMRLICCALTLALAGCSAIVPPRVVTEVKTVEVRVPVRVACLTAEEIPKHPARVMRPDADVRGLAAGAVAELREWEAYYARADALLRSCTQ